MRQPFWGIFLFAALVCFRAHAVIDISLQMQLGNPSGAIVDTNNHNHYLVQRTVESLDYSDNLGEPVWASWDLTASDVGTNARSLVFFTDTNLPSNFYRVTDNDYNGVGSINFNRGHLCPSEDRTDTRADNDAVFYMSNIMPQSASNNQGVWENFEAYCRTLATTNELLIMCGPSGFGTNVIPSGKAYIPSNTWKIAVVVPLGTGTALSRLTLTNRVISLSIPNVNNGLSSSWQTYVTSARQIELDTGFSFFSSVPPLIASSYRARLDGFTNASPPAIAGIAPTGGLAGTNVIITGTNFDSASEVAFNGSDAVFVVNSSTQIVAVVPVTATSGAISVTTSAGSTMSAGTFSIGATIAPSIVTQPQSLTVYSGSNASFTVSAAGTSPLSYQWFFNGTNIPGATASNYVRMNAQTNDAGNYWVVVTNISGSVTSAVATLTVYPPSIGVLTTLAGWDVSQQTSFGVSPLAPTTSAPGIIVGGLTRGSGVGTGGTSATGAWGGNGFTNSTAASAIASNRFATCSIMVQNGYTVSFSSISRFDCRRSPAGPTNGVVQYQIGSGAFVDVSNLFYSSSSSSGVSLPAINLSGIAALQNIGGGTNITFRIVNWNGTNSAGNWYIFDLASTTAPDFAITGIVNIQTNSTGAATLSSPQATAGNGFQFAVNGDAGASYIVQSSTNLADGNWQSIVTNVVPFTFSDTNIMALPQRFYRAIPR